MPEEGGAEGPEPAAGSGEEARRDRSLRVVVHDHSMEPALRPGDKLLVDPRAFLLDPPRRGDLVILRDPADGSRLLLKRVVATAGDLIRVTRTGVVRADAPSDGPPADPDALEELEVPPGHLFVLADRAAAGRDSRAFGAVPLHTVVGRVWFRYAPARRRGPL